MKCDIFGFDSLHRVIYFHLFLTVQWGDTHYTAADKSLTFPPTVQTHSLVTIFRFWSRGEYTYFCGLKYTHYYKDTSIFKSRKTRGISKELCGRLVIGLQYKGIGIMWRKPWRLGAPNTGRGPGLVFVGGSGFLPYLSTTSFITQGAPCNHSTLRYMLSDKEAEITFHSRKRYMLVNANTGSHKSGSGTNQ